MPRFAVTAIANVQYWLLLNPMVGRIEAHDKFGPFESKEAALAFHDAEKVEPYDDEGRDFFAFNEDATKIYRKNFRKGGPLEWANPLTPAEREQPGQWHHGVHEVVEYDNIVRGAQLP